MALSEKYNVNGRGGNKASRSWDSHRAWDWIDNQHVGPNIKRNFKRELARARRLEDKKRVRKELADAAD